MAILFLLLLAMVVGVVGTAVVMKHGGGLLAKLPNLSRFSSPYNVLITFGVFLALFLAGHNAFPSALGGALVVVGASTVLGRVVQAFRALLPSLQGIRVARPVRRKKVDGGYWDFVDGEWVEKSEFQEAGL